MPTPPLSEDVLRAAHEAVARNGGNQTHAARELGISRSTLRSRLDARPQAPQVTPEDPKVSFPGIEFDLLRQENDRLKKALKNAQAEALSEEAIRRSIFSLSEQTPNPPAWIANPEPRSKATQLAPVTLWSDWHIGEKVNPSECAGNRYDMEVARERVGRLVERTIDFCRNHMGSVEYPGIVVCLGGDMISGDIHEELAESNELATMPTAIEASEMIASGLERMANEFGRVFVPVVVGNHGRTTKKPRFKGRIATNWDWLIGLLLERHFKNDPRIRFHIPNETDAYFSVYGHRFLLTHGDLMGVKGGDGIIGALGPILRGSLKVGKSSADLGRPYATLLIGHWHQFINLRGVVVNGALKGYDEFAKGLRFPPSPPSQTLMFISPKWGRTITTEIFVDPSPAVAAPGEFVSVWAA